tara:strand:- start:1031 stop:1246 length:216 start_codon:yes stop_codon:yes gene_type:complete
VKLIDLHGVRHKDVYYKLENICHNEEIPFVVITGKSRIMKKIVTEIVATYGLAAHEKLGNNERLIVCKGKE